MSSGSTYGSVSSHSKSKRKLRVEAIDRAAYNVGQSLVTVVNDPRLAEQRGVFSWSFPQDDGRRDVPPPLDPARYPNVTRQDLEWYLKLVRGHLDKFAQDRQHIYEEQLRTSQNAERTGTSSRNTSGEGLVQAMKQVPIQYFQEDFSLSKPETIQQLFIFEDEAEIRERIMELNGHLDVVESQLLKEIAARSQSFFEAASSLHELRTLLCDTLSHIKTVRQQMHDMDEQTYQAAVAVTNLQRRRRNLHATHEHLKSLEEVVVSRRALDCFLESQDYAGTLELLENMRHTLEQQAAGGLQCFTTLPPQIKETISVVEALLVHEFLTTARHSELHSTMDIIIVETISAVEASRPPSHDGGQNASANHALNGALGASGLFGGSNNSVAGQRGDGTVNLRNVATLGSLSDLGLNGGLRDSSSGGVSTGSNPPGSGQSQRHGGHEDRSPSWALSLPPFSDDMREHLYDRLLPLVVGLYRQDVLAAAVGQLNDAVCADIKAAVNLLLERLLPPLLQHTPEAHVSNDADVKLSDKLQMLDHPSFLHLLHAVLRNVHASVQHANLVAKLTEEILKGLRAPRSVLLSVARDFTGLSHSLLEVAQGRWIKLVAARTQSHQRMKLYQFKELLSACESFGEYIEQQGAKPSANFKMSMQVQCKAHLESMHSRCTTQLQHVLEAETWMAVEVPASFQDIVDRLFARSAAPGPASKELAGVNNSDSAGEVSSRAAGHRVDSTGKENLADDSEALEKGGDTNAPTTAGQDLLQRSEASADHGGTGANINDTGRNGVGTVGTLNRDGTLGAAVTTGVSSWASDGNGGSGGSNARNAHALMIGGKRYHVVNASLILLKLMEEYLMLYEAVPMFGAETAQKVVELMKMFNAQTCQLVLGAGAMKTAGLKSISAKHLALSCQCLGAVAGLHPPLRAALISNVSPPWKALLLPEFDRLLQDVTLHMDEIHSKLVGIMQDRLQVSTRQIYQESETWGTLYTGTQASECVRLMTKQLITLNQVLSPILLPEEVRYIFGRVASLYSEALAETLDNLPMRGSGWELQRQTNVRHILQVFKELPLEPQQATAHLARLTTFYTKHYGVPEDTDMNGPGRDAAVPAA